MISQVCVVKETHPMTAEASHPGYSQSSPSKYMEVGMYTMCVHSTLFHGNEHVKVAIIC